MSISQHKWSLTLNILSHFNFPKDIVYFMCLLNPANKKCKKKYTSTAFQYKNILFHYYEAYNRVASDNT